MLNRLWTEEALGIAISGGADFAELFFEVSRSGGITLLDGAIDKISDNTVTGVGIRAFIGTRTVYASTSDTSREGLVKCARAVKAAIGEKGSE